MSNDADRILTTHVGSLPRPAGLLDLLRDKALGRDVDEAALAARTRGAVASIAERLW